MTQKWETNMKCAVAKYHDETAESEWERQDTAYRNIEFESTMFLINKYFPKKGKILDIGSGPGRYSFELANEKGQASRLYQMDFTVKVLLCQMPLLPSLYFILYVNFRFP